MFQGNRSSQHSSDFAHECLENNRSEGMRGANFNEVAPRQCLLLLPLAAKSVASIIGVLPVIKGREKGYKSDYKCWDASSSS